MEVSYQRNLLKKGANERIVNDVWIVNVIAVLRGTENPTSYAIMAGDIDSRASDVTNFTIDAPGANDNATGIAGILEAARVLSKYHLKMEVSLKIVLYLQHFLEKNKDFSEDSLWQNKPKKTVGILLE